MSISDLEATVAANLGRKLELIEAQSKSDVTAAQVEQELNSMRSTCLETAKKWPRKEALASVLLEKVQRVTCTPKEALSVLVQGAPVDAVDFLGRTALHWATQHDNVPVASMLMDFGAGAETPDATNTIPLHAAAAVSETGKMATLLTMGSSSSSFLQNCNGWSALHVAAFLGNVTVLRLLLSRRNVDLSPADSEGASCLHAAVGAGQIECVRLLIARGANLNAKTHAGDTPLHFAARTNNTLLVRILLKGGADRTQKNDAGISCGQGMAVFAKVAKEADEERAAHLPTDEDLPLKLPVSENVPEARAHHFVVDQKAVQAVGDTMVTFVLRTSPPRSNMRFTTCVSSTLGTETYGWTLDHRNGLYSITYRHPKADVANVTIALIEGGHAIARRSFSVATVEPRVVGRFCRGFGQGLFNPIAGRNQFFLELRDQCGTQYHAGEMSGLSVVVRRPTATPTVVQVTQDCRSGVYSAKFDLPASGIVVVDAQYQGQSIFGFPVDLNMDRAATLAGLFNQRKIDEDMIYLSNQLASVNSSVTAGKLASRRQLKRNCVACNQREVRALLLPCRHYRFCASCASGHVVLGTPCNVCKMQPEGYIVVKNDLE